MRCPTCDLIFRHAFVLGHGTHVNYDCACGQLLQWDQAVTLRAPALLSIGAPQPCQHPDLLKPDARVPLP